MKSNYKIGDVLLLEEYGVSGVVGYITPSGGLYGTWSDQEIDPEMDSVRKIGEREITLEERVLAEKKNAKDNAETRIYTGVQHLLKMAICRISPVDSDRNFRLWRGTIQHSLFDNKPCKLLSDKELLEVVSEFLANGFDETFDETLDIVCGYDMPYSRKELEANKEKYRKFVTDYIEWAYARRGNVQPAEIEDKLKELLAQM